MRINLRSPKVVMVTGAGSGIGRATAREFARDRATTVIVTDIDETGMKETVDLIATAGGVASGLRLDVTDPDEWRTVAESIATDFGVPDVLVNNAGLVVGGSFLDHTADDWDRQLGVNLLGVVHGCRAIGQQMVDRGRGGHIVNIASAAAYTPVAMMPAYCVSKAGVKMLSECLRTEFAAHGIGVSAICPGFINTDIGANGHVAGVEDGLVVEGKERLERLRAFADRLPIAVASPREVARATRAAVRLDLAVVPVRPEAWLSYTMSRVSPSLLRATGRVATADRARSLADRLRLTTSRN